MSSRRPSNRAAAGAARAANVSDTEIEPDDISASESENYEIKMNENPPQFDNAEGIMGMIPIIIQDFSVDKAKC